MEVHMEMDYMEVRMEMEFLEAHMEMDYMEAHMEIDIHRMVMVTAMDCITLTTDIMDIMV